MSTSDPWRDIEPMMSTESTDSAAGRRRTRNFFSVVNVDCISLGGDFNVNDETVPLGIALASDGDAAASVVSHEVTCFICLQDFECTGGKRPLQLTCGHNICMDCEGTLCSSKKSLRCPVCGEISTGPHRVNDNLVTLLGDEDTQKQRRMCAECGAVSIASFCEDCVLPLCAECDIAVHKQKPFMKHRRNKAEVAPVNRVLLTKCRLHFEELTEYCATCELVLCKSCVKAISVKGDSHDGHDLHLIKDAVVTQRTELSELSDESERAEGVFRDTLTAVREGLRRLKAAQESSAPTENSVTKTKQDINAHFDGVVSRLEARRKELLNQVDLITEHKVTSLKSQEAALSHLISRAYLATCRGRITTHAGSDIALADSYAALRQHLCSIANADTSNTAMREPIVDFYIPEFHGPNDIDITNIARYGVVGGPRPIQGVTCTIADVGTHVRLKWKPVNSRGRHEARSIEIQMSVKGTSRAGGMSRGRSDSYELSDDEEDAATTNLLEFVHDYEQIGTAGLDETEYTVDVSKYHDQQVYFRLRVVDTDMVLYGPWSAVCSVKTPKKFGKVLTFRSPFDEGGLTHFLGSQGKQHWSNPIMNGDIIVTASSYGHQMYLSGSGVEGFSMTKAGWLTGPGKSATLSPAGSAHRPPGLEQVAHLAASSVPTNWTMCTENHPGSWVCLDIGPSRLLKVTHYCLRNGAAVFHMSQANVSYSKIPKLEEGKNADPTAKLSIRSNSNILSRSSPSFSRMDSSGLPFPLTAAGSANGKCATLRSWHLQGRVREGGEWVTLSVHTRVDKDILPDIPYISAGWPVSSKLGAYRFFRVLQTGRNSIGNDILSIAGIDLYGTLF